MYNLGPQFEVDYEKALPLEENIIKGDKYRFTILTERLIRIQFNESSNFHDKPTQLVINRKFDKVDFDIKEDRNYLEVSTRYFKLIYNKNTSYKNSKNFRVELLNTDRFWYYNHVEAKNYPYPLIIENGKVKNTKSLYSLDGFVSIDDSKDIIISNDGTMEEYVDNGVDIYLFMYNEDFNLCLNDYFKLTGYPPIIPRFALGNWWSRNNDYNDTSLKELVDNFLKYEIPLSVILLDKDWHVRTYKDKNHLKTGFTFNKELFSSPNEMIRYLHTKGIRIGLNINPKEGFYDIDDNFSQAKKYLQLDENGVIPFNVLDPKWIDVYLKLYIHPLDALDTDFFWLDCINIKNLEEDYLLKYYQFNDMKRNYKRRPFIMGYNSLIAQHRYPVLYSGKTVVSWDSLKQIPLFNSNATNMGVSFYSHDVGGYFK
jgi:alpha-glucosidase (family GH31 glycosyl hydrolase)